MRFIPEGKPVTDHMSTCITSGQRKLYNDDKIRLYVFITSSTRKLNEGSNGNLSVTSHLTRRGKSFKKLMNIVQSSFFLLSNKALHWYQEKGSIR